MMSWNCPPITSVQALFRRSQRIRPAAQQFGGDGSLLGGIGQQLRSCGSTASCSACEVRDPAEWLISSRSPLYRGSLELVGLDIEEHLFDVAETLNGPSPTGLGRRDVRCAPAGAAAASCLW